MRHIINSFLFIIISLFIASSVSAIALNIDSPDEVNFDEEFTVKIDSDSTQTYDVKIFVYSSTDEKVTRGDIVSLIYWEDKWKDPWTYISSSFPLVKEYSIKVTEEASEYTLCAQFRIPGKTTIETKACKDLQVNSNSNTVDSEQPDKKEKDVREDTQEEEDEVLAEKPSPSKNQHSISTSAVNEEPDVKPEKIVLKSAASSSASSVSSFVTKEQKTRVYMLYGFAFFCLVLIVFLAIRKI